MNHGTEMVVIGHSGQAWRPRWQSPRNDCPSVVNVTLNRIVNLLGEANPAAGCRNGLTLIGLSGS